MLPPAIRSFIYANALIPQAETGSPTGLLGFAPAVGHSVVCLAKLCCLVSIFESKRKK